MSGKDFLFNKRRYRILLISIFIIGLGFIIMSGGESIDPDIFNNEIYNFRHSFFCIVRFILCYFQSSRIK